MYYRHFLQILLVSLAAMTAATPASPQTPSQFLFPGGTDGYHTYRIPALVRTPAGSILAFCEGRKKGPEDYGDIDLVFKRSVDGGQTWSVLHTVVDQGEGTWGNPTPVADEKTGRIWLFLSYNDANHNQYGNHGFEKIDSWGDRRVFTTYSDDDGLTWSIPEDKTATLVPKGYRWDAVGPGNGIQTKGGPNPGRLIIPAIGRNVYSDDHGATWHHDAFGGDTSEGTIVELRDGRLMRNDRSVKKLWEKHKRRMVSVGQIGEPWGEWHPHETLLTPRCQASSIRYEHGETNVLLFLNPASTERRWKMRLRASKDDGRTWPISMALPEPEGPEHAQPGGYSSLCHGADGAILALVEYNSDVRDRGSHKSLVLFLGFRL